VFLLITVVSVILGLAYARFVDRHFDPNDWRRWTALAPFWVLAVGMALDLHAVNMTDLAPQAIQAFAFVSLAETLIDAALALWRRRIARRDEGAALLRALQHVAHRDPNSPTTTGT